MSETAILMELQKLPNIGPAMARDLLSLGIHSPAELVGQDPHKLYDRLCALSGSRQDPCVLDTFSAVIDYAGGAPPRPWWFYSRRRKAG